MLVTRIAPTPSGYLHLGNAVNMLLTSWLARAGAGRLLLRIDDFDVARVRLPYLADIFATLDWLGIAIDEGPSGPAEFLAQWSMATRLDQFRTARDALIAEHADAVFACRCSRRNLDAQGRCQLDCAAATHRLAPGSSALRLRVPSPAPTVALGADRKQVPVGDHVLWRRDDLPAYQLGSVVADESLGVTALVRGADLRDSSALQVHLAGLLPAPGFAGADLRHHDLLRDPQGRKLSKSAGAGAHPLEHTDGLREQVHATAAELGARIGIPRP